MEQLAIPLGYLKMLTKWRVINQSRREQEIMMQHVFDM
jgi:hypothetical protein